VSIVLANLLVIWFGIIKVGPIIFPAGAVIIGLTFTFRDLVQRRYGNWWVWAWMITATLITVTMNWQIALASGAAFLVSEAVDWYLYSILKKPIKERIIWSNLFSTPLDSLIFVTMAFGWNWAAIWGQTLVKFVSSLIILPLIKRKGKKL
jgi:uncharacterized PurR-regulated membrane protein YhhQ (DUF165 family)